MYYNGARKRKGGALITALKKAYLEITNVCNLACQFCPGTRRDKYFLTPEQFQVLAGRLRPHTRYLYLHLMGEPLLHPQLKDILNCAGELGFRVMVTTNGTLLSARGGLLCASPAVERVSVSLHSFEGNSGAEGLGGYLEQCIQFAKECAGAGKRCALRLWNLDGAETHGANVHNGLILERLHAAFPGPWKEGWQGTTLAPRVYLEWGERFEWPDLDAREGDGSGFCYGLRDQVGVLCDGTVVPCCLDHEGDIPLGNLYQQSLEEILSTPRARAVYDGFSGGRAVEQLCRRCGYIHRFQ